MSLKTLTAMAMTRKEAIIKYETHLTQIIIHLIEYFLFDDIEQYNHWKQEIANFYDTLDNITIKPNNTKLPLDTLNKEVTMWFDMTNIDKLIKKAKDKYNKDKTIKVKLTPNNTSKTELYERAISFLFEQNALLANNTWSRDKLYKSEKLRK